MLIPSRALPGILPGLLNEFSTDNNQRFSYRFLKLPLLFLRLESKRVSKLREFLAKDSVFECFAIQISDRKGHCSGASSMPFRYLRRFQR